MAEQVYVRFLMDLVLPKRNCPKHLYEIEFYG
jgi:hypothetical protein